MVENIIYYFSGTGNSLVIAKSIAKELSHTEIISMKQDPLCMTTTCTKRVGFIFPTYYWGLPNMVENFMKKVRIPSNIYIFAITTCGISKGNSLSEIHRIFQHRDLYLSYGNSIRMVANYIAIYPKFQETEKTLAKSFVRLKMIVEDIREFEKFNHFIMNPLLEPIHRHGIKKCKSMDLNYVVSDTCMKCGLCTKVCPANNITLVDGHPLFHNRCEQCMACIQFCPTKSINYRKRTIHRERYHNPLIEEKELFN